MFVKTELKWKRFGKTLKVTKDCTKSVILGELETNITKFYDIEYLIAVIIDTLYAKMENINNILFTV